MGLSLESPELERLSRFSHELVRWNRKVNLTRIEAPRDIAIKHILDSLTPCRWIRTAASLLDLGSGAGFPGIPLKILRPDLSVLLVDASRKRVHFLKHVLRALELDGISAVQARADVLSSSDAYRGRFDVVISRAFSDIGTLYDFSIPLQTRSGILIAMKSVASDAELANWQDRVRAKGVVCDVRVEALTLPFSNDPRRLIIVSTRRDNGTANPLTHD